jgi:hypothetical protein
MKHHSRSQWERELEASQRNIVFPDTVRNDRFVNDLLWKGSPHATVVQRIGIALIGLTIFAPAVIMMFSVAHEVEIGSAKSLSDWIAVAVLLLIMLPFVIFGGKALKNAFLRPPSKSDHEHRGTDHKQHS